MYNFDLVLPTKPHVSVRQRHGASWEFAHTNYEKKKIRFRPSKEEQKPSQEKKKRGSKKGYQGQRKVRPKATKVIHVPAGEVCPHHDEALRPTELLSKRLIIDLVVAKMGCEKQSPSTWESRDIVPNAIDPMRHPRSGNTAQTSYMGLDFKPGSSTNALLYV